MTAANRLSSANKFASTLLHAQRAAMQRAAFASSSTIRQGGIEKQQEDTRNASTSSSIATSAKATPEQHSSSLSPRPKPPKAYSKLTVSLVGAIGNLMGYNTVSSTAIRTTSDLYDQCAQRAEEQAEFWYQECGLPRTYQSWFQITNMHVHLLLTRFRALPVNKAQVYSQELINHYFIDAESRMRTRFGVQTARLVKGYMREMHAQQRGAVLGLDEALSYSIVKETEHERFGDADAALATAFWRNLWGAGGWGEGVSGVKRKLRGVDRLTEEEKAARQMRGRSSDKKQGEEEDEETEGMPELAQDIGLSAVGKGEDRREAAPGSAIASAAAASAQTPTDQLHFAVVLQRLVLWYRRETVRLAEISNADIEQGRVGGAEAVKQSQSMEETIERLRATPSIAEFTKI